MPKIKILKLLDTVLQSTSFLNSVENNELITRYHTIFTTLFEKGITNRFLTSESQVVCDEMKNEQHVRNCSWYIGWVHPDHLFSQSVFTTYRLNQELSLM